jgi:hypothetical protein
MIKNSANKYFPKIQATCIGLPLAKLLPVPGTNLEVFGLASTISKY